MSKRPADTAILYARLTLETHSRLKALAARERKHLSEEVEAILREALDAKGVQ